MGLGSWTTRRNQDPRGVGKTNWAHVVTCGTNAAKLNNSAGCTLDSTASFPDLGSDRPYSDGFDRSLVFFWRPPHGGSAGTSCADQKTPKSVFCESCLTYLFLFESKGGKRRISASPISPAIYLHLNPKKNIKKLTFSDLRGYPVDRRPPPRLPQGPYRYQKGLGDPWKGPQAPHSPQTAHRSLFWTIPSRDLHTRPYA